MPLRSLIAAVRTWARRPAPPLGARGERLAARTLRRSGYRILARNLKIGGGEADLVALAPDRRTIVVVEVKTRLLGGPHPEPERSITAHKRAKLIAVARAVIKRGSWTDRPIRIDVIAIDWADPPARPTLRHYQSAVGESR